MDIENNRRYAAIFFWGIATLGCMILIFFMSHKPAPESAEMSGFIVEWLLEHGIGRSVAESLDFIVRKCAHMAEYFVLTYCASFLFIHIKKSCVVSIRILPVMIAVLYAISDEIHQLFVPGRAGKVSDVLIDSVGIAIAFVLLTLYFKCRQSSIYSVEKH